MTLEPPKDDAELVDRFGRELVSVFENTMRQVARIMSKSEVPIHKKFRAFLETIPANERLTCVAQSALERFVHDLLSSFDESREFKIVGTLKDGTEIDLRDLCPEGLHGNQLDWFEKYSAFKDTYDMVEERFPDV